MKKIIAVLLSIQLVLLSIQPTWAQLLPGKIAQGVSRRASSRAALSRETASGSRFTPINTTRLLTGMRLSLPTQNTGFLADQDYIPTAQQILAHPDAAERAVLWHKKFPALVLQHKASMADQDAGLCFYRTNLQQAAQNPLSETVADIASLGLLGTQQDGALILQTARQFTATPQEAAITAVAARALLRLEAYTELRTLAANSRVQPDLWDGIRQYIETYQLPLQLPETAGRKTVDVSSLQADLMALGPINSLVVNPSVEVTFLYMNAGRDVIPPAGPRITPKPQTTATGLEETPVLAEETPGENLLPFTPAAAQTTNTVPTVSLTAEEQKLAAVIEAHGPIKLSAENQSILDKTKQWLVRLTPKSADDTKFAQRAALYLTAFSIGLEIGTPIMASIKNALDLPLSYAILVTAATFSPYLFGSFIANWLKGKIGRKGTINVGLGLMGASLVLGTTLLGLDGSFTAWDNPLAQYFGLLGVLNTLSTGAVFIHNAAGPVMTEISQKTSELVRQKRGTYIEQSRAIGMLASFSFPFIATSMLGLDWSAPFVLALPIVGASAVALNWAKLPNTKFVDKNQEKVRTSNGKLRSTTSYLHLLREAPGVGSFISGLFLMNAVEVALNSGLLFVLPQLTGDESLRYLLGMIQYSIAFLAGRFLAKHFLDWFPKRNLSIATLLTTGSAALSLGLTDNMYALTAALFTAELGISTAFTLAYARTAKDHTTQDKITSLIMASAISCAVGPFLLTQIGDALMQAGILNETGATVTSLIAIPTILALISAKLFRRTENKTVPGLANGPGWKETLQKGWQKVRSYFQSR
mgnify:CR=1 FL=1